MRAGLDSKSTYDEGRLYGLPFLIRKGKMMENPLLLPRPDDPIQQIHDYARDLAYMTLQNEWYRGSSIPDADDLHLTSKSGTAHEALLKKWGSIREPIDKLTKPNYSTLESFGYLKVRTQHGMNGPYPVYILTSKAFQLLEKPLQPPTIFISYRRMESSAFALLIESRLRFVGVSTVFIDKNIDAGTQWEKEIEAQVRQCKTFIVLIGPETLKSPMVRKEIQWAQEQGARIIPIWHNGHALEKEPDCPQIISMSNDIRVEGLAAKHYETAINELLNTLGYRTY